jgi:hypothetical protein
MRRLLVKANVVPSSPILVTLVTEALGSSVTSQKTVFFIVTAVKTSNLTLGDWIQSPSSGGAYSVGPSRYS